MNLLIEDATIVNIIMETQETIASFLMKVMELKGLSQRKLAKVSGVDRGHINAFIKGRRKRMGRQTAERLAPVLGVPLLSFFTFDSAPRSFKAILSEIQQAASRLEVVQIPIVGGVPAGYPSLEEENIEGYVSISKEELHTEKEELYALRVHGDSLSGDGIYYGDLVIVEPDAQIVDGKIYILRLGDGCVARHIYRQENKLKLVSSDGNHAVIEANELELLGRVILSGRWKKH